MGGGEPITLIAWSAKTPFSPVKTLADWLEIENYESKICKLGRGQANIRPLIIYSSHYILNTDSGIK